MRITFCHLNAVLRDSHIAPEAMPESLRLMPATLEAMRLLNSGDNLLFLYGPRRIADQADAMATEDVMEDVTRQIESGGGRVDGTLVCQHEDSTDCQCWTKFPGMLWLAATEMRLDLSHAYVLADDARDVQMALAAGSRPMAVLGNRSIVGLFGNRPGHKGFPIVQDLLTAVRYIDQEEESRETLGKPRMAPVALPSPETLYEHPESLPRMTVLSRRARERLSEVARSRVQLQDMGRWLSFFSLGALGLSLGIAYLLTHLYRLQPFPPIVYYVTLQFIPRPVRGALFILWGVGVILLAIRSFYRSTSRWQRPDGDGTP